ncbi:hypothetical protein O3602_07425 [Streptococcus sp. 27098_8_186]|uniref:hypothetical protein n=1 Tax=Streptococcus TaxID=1301 RepID=UPI00021BD017|nr:hypothetical protein [Streptococcus parasanguinis]EGU62639.1 hypothetical protein HMPREF9962_0138 [Streptococcus parasanguinis SK236]RHE63784.1 hypothetical protein DW728_05770 [Streptococcus parasanguinis]
MAEVKINNISELESYGNNIKDFSDKYEVETNALYRNFTDKAGSDSKGEAINAYFEKLNNIQSQVFSELPSAIKKYGEVVTTYVSEIRDTEFVDQCYSSDTGANDLSSLLKGSQTNDIFNLSKDLDGVFQQAADAMGNSPYNTEGVLNTATTDLENAATKRIEKDQAVQDAYNKFTKNLDDETAAIKSFQDILNNAIYFSDIPSSAIFQAIANGYLTAEQMYYLDVPKTKEDAQALKAIISDKPGDVLKVDPNKISEEMYAVIANEQNDWTLTENNEMWQHFVNALGDYSVERNDIFTNGILKAEDALAQIKMLQMFNLLETKPDDLPENASLEQKEEYDELMKQYQLFYDMHQSELNAINSNLGLMYSLQLLEIGDILKPGKMRPDIQAMEDNYYKTLAEVEIKNGQFEIKIDRGEYITTFRGTSVQDLDKARNFKVPDSLYKWESKKYTSTTEYSDFGMQASEYSNRMKKLQDERSQASVDFAQNMFKSIAKSGISLLPNGSAALSLISTLESASDEWDFDKIQSTTTTTINDFKSFYKKNTGQDIPPSKLETYWGHWSKFSSGLSGVAEQYEKYASDIAKIDKETSEARNELMEKILDYGGWDLSENGNYTIATGRGSHYYDFNAALRAKELNESGLKGYINKATNLTENDLDAAINKTFTEEKDKQTYSAVISYVRGEKSDLKLEDMTADQLEKFTTIVKNLGRDGMSGLGDYFDTEYQIEEVKPYSAT